MTTKSITVKEIIALMRQSTDEGVVLDRRTGQTIGTIAVVLRQRGATAEQAASAARQLGWASDSVDDWSDALPVR
jgi:hypothetical protein